jgi:hypothetical protein
VKMIVFVIWAIILFIPTFARAANVYVEGSGNYGKYGDAKKMTGFGVGLGVNIAQNVNAYLKYFKVAGNDKNAEYKDDTWMCVGEYNYPLKDLPLVWTSSAGAGYSLVMLNPTGSDKKHKNGLFMGAWTGIRYIFSQHLNIFATIGYHRLSGLQKNLGGIKIRGYQMVVGVTGTIWGENNTLESDF